MLKPNKFLVVAAMVFTTVCARPLLAQEAEEPVPQARVHEGKTLDLSRSVDTSKRMTGSIVFKPIGHGKTWPFFVTRTQDGKQTEFKIETCDETCKAEIDKCKGGERCVVKAEVSTGDGTPLILARTFKVLAKKSDEEFDKNFSFEEVKPGDFMMGSDPKGSEKDSRYRDEVPHKVSITRGYEIGKKEVTRAQWKKIMGHLPKEIENDGKSDDLPITHVSWEDANEFTKRLTRELSETAIGQPYRCTESEAIWR